MLKNKQADIQDAWDWLNKIIVWPEKIVYEDWEFEYTLITYIQKTEYDKIEYRIINLIRYHENKKPYTNWH